VRDEIRQPSVTSGIDGKHLPVHSL